MLRHGLMKGLHGVEQDFDLRFAVRRGDLLHDLCGDLLWGERLVDANDVIYELAAVQRARQLRAAGLVDLRDDVPHVPLLQHGDRRLEGGEVAHLRHVDAVRVREADLRAAGHDDDPLRRQPVQRPEDGVLQRVAAHDRVVQSHQHIALLHGAVVHVVGVDRKVLAGGVLLDEGADLRILVHDLLRADGRGARLGEGLLEGDRGVPAALAPEHVHVDLRLPPAHLVLRLLLEADEGQLGRVGDEGEHGVLQAVALCLQHLEERQEHGPAEALALPVDPRVVPAREVDALEGALLQGLRGEDRLQRPLPAALDDNRLAGGERVYLLRRRLEYGLDQGRLTCHDDDLVVGEVERGADAAGIPQHEGVAVAEAAGDAVAAVPVRGRATQDPRHVDVLGDVAEARARGLARGRVLDVEVVVLLVHEVADLLQERDRV
mmetsp:Transcript_56464/g.148477  ORF Transcript_56464/g.148477 Transcript_56464/m.148477 type:complete len:433 (+) Transcript_56464:3761-5059(+)